MIRDTEGPFHECLTVSSIKKIVNNMFYGCMFDACDSDPDYIGSVCAAIEIFAERCEDVGYQAVWRSESFCRKLLA